MFSRLSVKKKFTNVISEMPKSTMHHIHEDELVYELSEISKSQPLQPDGRPHNKKTSV